jgi:hypothetical protein
MGERVLEMAFVLVATALLACGEIVELVEPKAPAPEWRYRSYRAALRLTSSATR